MSERSDRPRGGAGHPEPGSGHDDAKTETVEQGPPSAGIDGVPGAHGDVEVRGGAAAETETHGPGAEVDEEAAT
jgi:hypothetical protein